MLFRSNRRSRRKARSRYLRETISKIEIASSDFATLLAAGLESAVKGASVLSIADSKASRGFFATAFSLAFFLLAELWEWDAAGSDTGFRIWSRAFSAPEMGFPRPPLLASKSFGPRVLSVSSPVESSKARALGAERSSLLSAVPGEVCEAGLALLPESLLPDPAPEALGGVEIGRAHV